MHQDYQPRELTKSKVQKVDITRVQTPSDGIPFARSALIFREIIKIFLSQFEFLRAKGEQRGKSQHHQNERLE